LRRSSAALCLLLLCLALLCGSGSAFATEWFVSTTGSDSNDGLTRTTAFATLHQAVFHNAQPGDTVSVCAGTYATWQYINGDGYCSEQVPNHGMLGGSPGAYITIQSVDGDLAAQFTSGLNLTRCQYIKVVGFDFSVASGGPIKITSGCDDYYTADKRSHHIEVLRCRMRDWSPAHYAQVKNSASDYLLYEDCEMYNNPENPCMIDCVWCSYSTFRRLYIHDFWGGAVYTKGGSQYNVLEQSVISYGNPASYTLPVQTGDGTGLSFCNPDEPYETAYSVVRDNIFRETTRAGIFTTCVNWYWVYNNIVADVGDARALYNCYRPYVVEHDINNSGEHCNNRSDHVRIVNNIFLDTAGDMYGPYGYDGGDATDWIATNNNYYNNGNAIGSGYLTIEGHQFDPNNETGATIGDPHLTLSGTPTTRQGWIDYYRPLWDSQSNAMLKDKGSSTAGGAPRPGVVKDIEGNVRPRDGGWDIGPYEYQGAVATPNADFAADKTVDVAPATISFADYSSGGPTSWSWSFGDSSTSTAQNPTHVYTTYGFKTVALTVTNSAGNDTETKTDYLSIQSLLAGFTATPLWGEVPLSVTFTDTSTNSPTAWSWTFGDGATSAVQNPTHQYTATGTYTVSLTATNVGGSDSETKANYIAACNQYTYSPTNWLAPHPADMAHKMKDCDTTQGSFAPLSGSVSDLAVKDGVYMAFPYPDVPTAFVVQTPFTTSQVRAMRVEITCRATYPDNPGGGWYMYGYPGGTCALADSWLDWGRFPFGDQWLDQAKTFDTQNILANAVSAAGEIRAIFYPNEMEGASHGGMQYDYVKVIVWAIPSGSAPVANFTGNPTSGAAPLAVSFTDTSTNTPTSWSWDFGDSTTSTVQNPSHTYNNVGNYTVSLTATNASGSDGETKTNYITATGPAPVADFTADQTIVPVGSTVNFTDASTNSPTSWSWSFGDSTTSTAQNPSHSYSAVGYFTVSLTATNGSGSDGETKTNYITVGTQEFWYPDEWVTPDPPDVRHTDIYAGSLADLQTDNDVYFVIHPSVYSCFTWLLFTPTRDPATIAKMTLEYQWHGTLTDTPKYDMTIRKSDASFEPLLAMSLWPTTDQTLTWSTTNPGGYYWNDGTKDRIMVPQCACAQNSNHFYTYVDMVRLSLVIFPNAPVANFSGAPTSGTAPLAVSFTDSSTGSPTSWSWAFGDSSTSTAQNPSHTYNSAGNYTVSLTATNANGSDGETKTDYITVTVAPPVADFSGNPTTGTAPLAVSFTDTSTNTPTSWSWTFGDSNTSTAQNPSHTYAVGTYTVSLTATNAGGSDGETKTNYITATQPAPVANFSGTPTSGTVPLAVDFTDTSTNTPTAWSWEFGDSNTSTVQNPSHTYAVGTYTVSLTAANAGGSDAETKTNYITVTPPPPVADFTADQTIAPVGSTVSFTDASTNSPTSWSWTFGDSSTSTAQNPSHTYNSAAYCTVSLTATNAGGSDGETKTNYLTVGTQEFWYPDEWVTPDPPDNRHTDIYAGSLADLQTDNDVYFVIHPSVYSCFTWMLFTPTRGGSTIAKMTLDYQWHGTLTDTPKYDMTIRKSDASFEPLISWQFWPTTDQTLTWSTTNAGGYYWNDGNKDRIMVPQCACAQNSNHFYTYVDLVRLSLVVLPDAPTANFTGAPTSGNVPLAVSFTDSSTGSPTAWSWTFGDGNASTVQSPSHTYASAGTYTVSLVATNSVGWDSETKTDYITVTNVPAPVANFSGTPTTGNAPLAVSFTDSSTNTPTAWSWDFGDSSTSTVQNPSHTYAAGTYTVSLTAANAGGSDGETKTNYITVTVAAPTYVAAGSVASGTGAITPALPSGRATNDILLLFLETANQAISITNQNGGTWTQVTNSPQSVGSGSTATRLTVFWSRYNGTQGAPTTSDSGDHQAGRIIAIRGATTSGDPCDVTAGGTESTADTSGAIPGATTTVANALVVAAIATSLPDSNGTSNFSAWANADLTSVTERTDNTRSSGNGGGIGVATGVKATAGAYTTTSVTCGTASTKAMMSIAIKP